MPTYDGTKIVTGTLYDNRTIIVKPVAFCTSDMILDGPCNTLTDIKSATLKSTISSFTQQMGDSIMPCAERTALTTATSKTTTILFEQKKVDDSEPSVDGTGISNATIRTAIVVP